MSDQDKRDARNRLAGRAVIIGFGLLVAAYLLATFWR
jgi:hypothetical protein